MILKYLKLQRSLGVEDPRRRRTRMLTLIPPDSLLSRFPSGWTRACVCVCVCARLCVGSSSGQCWEHMSAVSMVTRYIRNPGVHLQI